MTISSLINSFFNESPPPPKTLRFALLAAFHDKVYIPLDLINIIGAYANEKEADEKEARIERITQLKIVRYEDRLIRDNLWEIACQRATYEKNAPYYIMEGLVYENSERLMSLATRYKLKDLEIDFPEENISADIRFQQILRRRNFQKNTIIILFLFVTATSLIMYLKR